MEPIIYHYIGESLYMLAGLLVGYLWKALRARQRDTKEKDRLMELVKDGMCAHITQLSMRWQKLKKKTKESRVKKKEPEYVSSR